MSATVLVEKSRWIEMGKRFESAIAEAEQARKTTVDAFNQLLEERTRTDALEHSLSQTQEDLKNALCQLSDKESEVEILQSRLELVNKEGEEKFHRERHEERTASELYTELRDELQELKRDRDEIGRENNSLRDRISQLENNLRDKSTELAECIEEAQEKINEKRNRITDLQDEQDKMRISMDQLQTENSELKKRVEVQHSLQHQLRSASEMLKSHVLSLTEALQLEHSRNADSVKRITLLEHENSELREKLQESKENSKKKIQEMVNKLMVLGAAE